MQVKLKQIKTEITTTESLNLFKQVFYDESDEAILNFHLMNYSYALHEFIYKLNPSYTCEDIFFIFLENQVIGYVTAYESRWPEIPYGKEFGIFIKETYRNRGLGTEVITHIEAQYKQPYVVSPRCNNIHAIRLYERLGYVSAQVEQEDLLLMFK